MMNLVPRPISDLIHGFVCTDNTHNEKCFDKRDNAIGRIAICALGAFAVIKLGAAVKTTVALGAVLSVPAALIAGGGFLLCKGVPMIVASLASGSFPLLGIGLAVTTTGYFTLEYHDVIQLGIIE